MLRIIIFPVGRDKWRDIEEGTNTLTFYVFKYSAASMGAEYAAECSTESGAK